MIIKLLYYSLNRWVVLWYDSNGTYGEPFFPLPGLPGLPPETRRMQSYCIVFSTPVLIGIGVELIVNNAVKG